MDEKLKEYLSKHNINFKQHMHKAVFTVAESQKIKDPIPGMHTKNLFLKDENKKYYLVCMFAHKKLNIKNLKSHLKVKELHFSSPEELKEQLNLTPGSVSIFGMIYTSSVYLIIDKDIFSAEISTHHPNINTETLELTHNELEKFLSTLKSKFEILEI
jgi:Ala-tRNA(Pro) deacylase